MNRTIITSMYNRTVGVVATIDKLFFPSLLGNASSETELVILDDHSPLHKETQALVDKYLPDLRRIFGDVTYKRNSENLGFAGSFNRGIQMANGGRLLIANDDLYFPRGTIERLFNTLDEPPGYLIVGPVTNANTAFTYQYCKQAPTLRSFSSEELGKLEMFALYLEGKLGGQRIVTDDLCGFCFAADAAVLKEMGGFDESFKYGFWEDVDLIQRIVEKFGMEKVAINLGVFINHGGTAGSSGTMNQQPIKMVTSLLANSHKYARKWGWRKLIKRMHFGFTSPRTGKGTVSELL